MQGNSSAPNRLSNAIALACNFLLLMSSVSLGQEQIVDGVISAINAPESVIIVESKSKQTTYKLASQASIRVGGKSGDFSQLRVRMAVKLIYDAKLNRVTAVATSGSSEGEIIELSELPVAWSYGSPWVAQDGLTIYWSARASARAPRDIFLRLVRQLMRSSVNRRSCFPVRISHCRQMS